MVTDTIQYLGVEASEKVIMTLAGGMEEGFAGAFDQTIRPIAAKCARVQKSGLQAILKSFDTPAEAVEVRYHRGLEGNGLLLIDRSDLVRLIEKAGRQPSDQSSPGTPEAFVEYFSRAARICNRSFSARYGHQIDCETPELINSEGDSERLASLAGLYEGVLCLTFHLSAGDAFSCRVEMLIQPDLKESLMFLLPDYKPEDPPSAAEAPDPSQKGMTKAMSINEVSPPSKPVEKQGSEKPLRNWNIDLLLDVELPIVVSFGEAEMPLKDVLKLGVGSVIELDKSLNDPVTVIVNQKPIAKGEVVMVDGNYGVRILEVESTADRIKSLG